MAPSQARAFLAVAAECSFTLLPAVPNLAETRFQRGANNIRRVSSRSTTVAMTAKDAHAALEVSVPPETHRDRHSE
jgi:hypothetical protein